MVIGKIRELALGLDLSKTALQYLIQNCKTECEWLDYKIRLDIKSPEEKCKFTKDVIAIKNMGGGYIILGVEDKVWNPKGLSTPFLHDSKELRDVVKQCSGLDIDIDVVSHELFFKDSYCLFALICIRGRRNPHKAPFLVIKDHLPNLSYGLHRGDIYARKGDSTIKVTSQEELLTLIDNLSQLVSNEQLSIPSISSIFAIDDGCYRLLEKGYDKFVGREEIKQRVYETIVSRKRVWLFNIYGPGGVGKTALVNYIAHEFYKNKAFEAILQLSAKETQLTPSGITRYGRSLHTLEDLLDHILDMFNETIDGDYNNKIKFALEMMKEFPMLLVLDNMETVTDKRIINFITDDLDETKAKVLMTSRHKTCDVEYPFQLKEFDEQETIEFIQTRNKELDTNFVISKENTIKLHKASNGLPLALQWILGCYKLTGKINTIIDNMNKKDSQILEYSFGFTWDQLSSISKEVLKSIALCEEPPTLEQIELISSYKGNALETALEEIKNAALLTAVMSSNGREIYACLPITINYIKSKIDYNDDNITKMRETYELLVKMVNLTEIDIRRNSGVFSRFDIVNEQEKKAIIVSQRGVAEMMSSNNETAELYFSQALDLAPKSAYVMALYANYLRICRKYERAIEMIERACGLARKKTAAYCYQVKADIHNDKKEGSLVIKALGKALEYDPYDVVLIHKYGVALSRFGEYQAAIVQFDRILEIEKNKPTRASILALKTKLINLRKLDSLDEIKETISYADEIMSKNVLLAREYREFEEFKEKQ